MELDADLQASDHAATIDESGRHFVHKFSSTDRLLLRAATDESQKTLNKCETRNKTVFDTRLRHPEKINSVPLNSVLRIKQTCV